jgi:hypothetical protein
MAHEAGVHALPPVSRTADEQPGHVCGQGAWPGGCKRYGVLRAAWEAINGTLMLREGQ